MHSSRVAQFGSHGRSRPWPEAGGWVEQDRLQQEAATLAEVFQRSSSDGEGRNGYLSLRNHALRGLNNPRKRACLTAVHNFLLTRLDGTTAAERFFGQKPRSMCAAILEIVEIPPLPLVRRDEPWVRLKGIRWLTP